MKTFYVLFIAFCLTHVAFADRDDVMHCMTSRRTGLKYCGYGCQESERTGFVYCSTTPWERCKISSRTGFGYCGYGCRESSFSGFMFCANTAEESCHEAPSNHLVYCGTHCDVATDGWVYCNGQWATVVGNLASPAAPSAPTL